MRCSRCERRAWMNRAWRRSSHQPLSHSRRQTITLYPGAQHRGRPESLDSRLSLPISIVGCPPRGAFSCLETRWLENAWTRNEKRQKETGSLAAPVHTPLALGLSVVEGQLDRWPCHRDASFLRMASRRRRSPAGRPRKKDMVNPPRVHGSRTLPKLLCASQTPATCCRSLALPEGGGGCERTTSTPWQHGSKVLADQRHNRDGQEHGHSRTVPRSHCQE